jgi:anti-sigma factor RsiW
MGKCDLPIDLLTSYEDGSLQGARREFVEAHLHGCPRCRERVRANQSVTELLRGSILSDDDPHAKVMVRQRIREESLRRTPVMRSADEGLPTLLLESMRSHIALTIVSSLLVLAIVFDSSPSDVAWFISGILVDAVSAVSTVIGN